MVESTTLSILIKNAGALTVWQNYTPRKRKLDERSHDSQVPSILEAYTRVQL